MCIVLIVCALLMTFCIVVLLVDMRVCHLYHKTYLLTYLVYVNLIFAQEG